MAVVSPYEYAWSSISPLVSSVHGWSPVHVGLIFSLFVVFQSGASFPTGLLRDRYGPRALTFAGGLLSGLGLAALASGSLVAAVLGFGVVGSFGVGIVYSNAINTGNKWYPDKRGLAAGLIAGAFSWGSIPVVIWIRSSADAANYPAILIAMAVIVGVVIVGSSFVMRDPARGWRPALAGAPPHSGAASGSATATGQATTAHPAAPTRAAAPPGPAASSRPAAAGDARQFAVREALGTWQFWVIYLAFVLVSGAGLMTIAKIVGFAAATGHAALVGTTAAVGLAVTNGLGRPVLGKLADRLGYEVTMTGSFTLAGLFLLLMTVTGSSAVFVFAALAGLFFWGPLFSLFPAITGHYYGADHAAATYGVLYSAKMVGGLWGGWASALIMERYGFRTAFVIGAVMAIVSGLLVIAVKRRPPGAGRASGGVRRRNDSEMTGS